LLLFIVVLTTSTSSAQNDSAQTPGVIPRPQITIDDDGTYHLPAQTIPMSSLMSKELKDSLIYMDRALRDPKKTEHQADGSTLILKPFRDRQAALYPLDKQDTKIGDVHVFVYTPKDGVAAKNKNRILIYLHSADCWIDCGALGSQPIAYIGKIKVVSVDYRVPEFPSAMEDVTNVYSGLLRTYKPRNIGIYGCSRGGIVAARSLAWFQKHNLPRPGAVGILCASAGGDRGDARYIGSELGNGVMPQPPTNQGEQDLGNIDPDDPMVNPVNWPEVLSKFPPTLLITGTRSIDMSTGVYTHEQLVKLGVETDLHVFEGGRHEFWYDPAPPESQEVYDIIVRFFDHHLGTHN
jgi:acetyl esterase/lipase